MAVGEGGKKRFFCVSLLRPKLVALRYVVGVAERRRCTGVG